MNTKKSFGQRMKKSWQKGDITMWIMLLPTIFFILVMSVYPFLWLIRYVFYDYNGFKAYFVGLDNFKRVLTDKIYWNSVLHTFEYAVMKLLFVIPLSLVTAVLLQRKRFGSGFCGIQPDLVLHICHLQRGAKRLSSGSGRYWSPC